MVLWIPKPSTVSMQREKSWLQTSFTRWTLRVWKVDEEGELLVRDGKPVSFSKEFARGMVKEKGQQFSQEQANEIAIRYVEGLQLRTSTEFRPDLRPRAKNH